MGRLSVFLVVAGFFISVCAANKLGGSKNRNPSGIIIKNNKNNLRKVGNDYNFSELDNKDNDELADETQSSLDNPPDPERQAQDDQSNNENKINAETRPNDYIHEEPEHSPHEEDPKPQDNHDILSDDGNSPDKPNPSLEENDGELASRGIKSGDTFTPHELLPVTRKLLEKVENPGEGRGIVSSLKTPEALADVLFEAFFFGPRRIVILNEQDVVGLDALQALALSGDEARRMPEHVTSPGYLLDIEDQIVKINNSPRTSKYMLLTKSGSTKSSRRYEKKHAFKNRKNKRMIKRRVPNSSRLNLKKKLQKKRQLVVNPARKNNKINKTGIPETSASTKINKRIESVLKRVRKHNQINKTKVIKNAALAKINKGVKIVNRTQNPKISQKNKRLQKPLSFKKGTVASNVSEKLSNAKKQTNNNSNQYKSPILNRIKGNPATPRPTRGTTVHRTSPLCRWRYECTNPGDLDTCKLHTQCKFDNLKATTNGDFIGPVQTDEEMRNLRRFRKMLGISRVDEEVEKILEARVLQFKPLVLAEKPARIESLAQYFNNIIVAQLESTTKAANTANYDDATANANAVDEEDIKDNSAVAEDGAGSGDNNASNNDQIKDPDLNSESKRKRSYLRVPHTGRPFLKKMN